MSDFIESSVAYGLNDGGLSHLSVSDKERLISLMARISERSYRRGFQHGCIMDPLERVVSPSELRHQWPLGKSPYTDTAEVISSTQRLFVEYPVLQDIGFRDQAE